MQFSRRGLLIGTLAGGGLAIGYLLRPRQFSLPLNAGRGEVAFDAWIKIAGDGVITVAVPQLEMGQGITTLIPQIVAEELGADWRQLAVESTPVSAHYANLPLAARWAELWMPVLAGLAEDQESPVTRRWAQDNRFMATADGMSLAAYEGPARAAAASARAMLSQAAAAQWDIGWEECTARDGFILHGDKRLSFASLSEKAVGFDPPETPPLRPAAATEAPGKFQDGTPPDRPRLDLPAKVDGSYLFSGDVRLPGMVYAAIRHGPIGKTELAHFDEPAAKEERGYISLVRGKDWLAAVAETGWAAERVLREAGAVFKSSARAESGRIEDALDRSLKSAEGQRVHETGDPNEVLDKDFSLVVRYEVAPALHATVETASATARLADGMLELWIATQAPEAARKAAGDAVGLDVRDVVLYPMPAGGSFDRRLEHGHAVEAAIIAKQTGRPVQLTWSRWQEHVAGLPRTPVGALLGAKTTLEGDITGWRARLALPATTHEFGRRLFGAQSAQEAMAASSGETDRLAMEGSVPPYAITHMAIEHLPTDIGLPTARMRGNAHGYTAFFNESFVDELAHAGHREPLSFRMAMLGGEPRLAECLQKVATLAGWGGGGDNSGQGLACHIIGDTESGGRIAAVATARRDEGGVRVDSISAVVDIGRIVNVDIARQQVEGGLIFGIGLALGSGVAYDEGLPLNGRLAGLNLPLLADCPEVEVEFIESDAPATDPGELGVAVAAPAIANALFSATGLRFRRLPLLSEGL
ncbi:MAG: molybdopterin-dependent oxidoreductase [Novosphingobium sp.]|nr:molybdopterin-dependent oxidoreductase [Novosphingobium sp.]